MTSSGSMKQTESSLEEERAYASDLYGTKMIVEAFIKLQTMTDWLFFFKTNL